MSAAVYLQAELEPLLDGKSSSTQLDFAAGWPEDLQDIWL